MSKMSKKILVLAITSCIASPIAQATNGMFLIGNGNKSQGMGGTGIALQLDSLSGATNPATLAGMGNRFDIGMDLFYVNAESQLGSVSDESIASVNAFHTDKLFMMPAMAISYEYSSDITLGFSMAPTGGGGTVFTTNFFEAAAAGSVNTPFINDKLGVDLIIMEMNPTISYNVNDKNNVGASLVLSVSRFSAYGLKLFDPFTSTLGSLEGFSNQGKDWTWGAGIRLGWLGTYDNFTLGAVYTSRVYQDEFNHYTELFAEQGDLDIPAILGVGASYKAMPDLLLAMDITYTFYEDVKAIGNAGPNLPDNPDGPLGSQDRTLGLDDGLGFGWDNQAVIKVGAEYTLSNKWTLRSGWNYGKSPIDENEDIIFNLLAPASTQHHLTFGGTYNLASNMEINFSYVHAFKFEQSGPTYISDDGTNSGSLSMSQDSLGGSFSYKF